MGTGRRESPLDPAAGPVERFASELRKLRQEAGGLTYREMARKTSYATATLAQAAAGAKLPSLPVTLAYVAACGGDGQAWEQRWHDIAAAQRAQPPADDGAVPPYPGLRRFQPEDQERFFGRDQLTADLTALTHIHRLVAVVGASGSGKSSLLRAGLIPALRDGAATRTPPAAIRIFTPGPHPVRTYARQLVAAEPDGDTVVIVDQFEEVFTLCRDAAERAEFIGLLLAARRPASRLRLVIGVRADFFGRCAGHRELADALREATVLVGPMTPAELREAIVKPAAAHGLVVERALTARIVDEVADEPGGLPLMSHALLETWRRRKGGKLDIAGYEAAGGVRGAIAHTAEEIYQELPPHQAAYARRILLQLVTPGEGTEDTRRPVNRTELEELGELNERGERDAGADGDVTTVLERLVRARLITLDDAAPGPGSPAGTPTAAAPAAPTAPTVDVAHEALITSWPRLRGWIDEDREHLVIHRRLTDATAEWEALERDPGALYRGTRLATAEEHFVAARRQDELTQREAAFLTAGITARNEEQRADARRGRRLRYLATGLAVLLVMVTGIGVVALRKSRQATAAQQEAISRQLAVQATELADSRPDTAMLLSVEAYRAAPTPEARGALLTMSTHQSYRTKIGPHTKRISGIAFGPDGTLATVSRDKTVRLWDPTRRTRLATLTGPDAPLRAVTFSADGQWLATGGDDGDVVLWDVAERKRTATLSGHTEAVRSVAFSRGGRLAASGAADGTVRLWDISRGKRGKARDTLPGSDGAVNSVAISPDGRTVSGVGDDGKVRLWSVATGKRLDTMRGHTGPVHTVAFSPDGRTLATAGHDRTVRLWDVRSRERKAVLTGHTRMVRTLEFSPDGGTLATAGHDRTAVLWDVKRRVRKVTLTGHSSNVYGVAFDPRGTLLASHSEGRVVLWDVTRIPLTGHSDRVNDVAFSRDGRSIATAGDDGTIAVWDARRRIRKAELAEGNGDGSGPVNAVAFSPDGRTVAAATGAPQERPGAQDNTLTLWNPEDRSAPTRLTGHTDRVMDVAYSPDGRMVATAGQDGKIVLWDAERHTRLATLESGADRAASVTFSPDGRLLATTHPGKALIWDAAKRTRVATLRGHSEPLTDAAFSPDGRSLATSSRDQRVILWDVAEHTRKATLVQNTGPALAVAFGPDGRTLATASANNAVALWSVDRREILATLSGHTEVVSALAFSPDSRTLATASDDHTAQLWNTDPQRTATQLCARLDRNLSRAEWRRFLPGLPYHRTCGTR
ncbi:nSTAND1 domain-containing NTPase [Streptomyces sp. 8N114]|uniref:nSTAND1 domain-containing NTPase n=1 Tax=Streptomyces sp. 8N114 TaxID=3457419 RepID=UPI003FD58877